MISAVLAEITRRSHLFTEVTGFPDNLDDYNGRASLPNQLPRLVVVLDEFNGLVQASGGPRGRLAQAATQVARQGRKFGVTLVLAGQDFTKEIVGPVRDQMTSRVCFRVATAITSRVVLGRSGAERLKLPGRAWSTPWELLQTYWAELPRLLDSDGLTPKEHMLAANLIREFGGRMTYEVLNGLGIGRREAERVRADWLQRGLANVKPEEKNALYVNEDRFSRAN